MSATETLTRVPVGTWKLDPVHSSIGFQLQYLAGTFRGEFREVEATLAVEGERASLEGKANVASVDVKDENLAAHLQSPDFFDAERHPELRFGADELRLDNANVEVRGEITIRGVAKAVDVTGSVAAPMVDGYGNDRVGLELAATVNRKDFGIAWNMELPNGEPALPDDVRIVADLQFVKPA